MPRLSFLLLITFALAGCGVPGAPQPPSLNIPKPVQDLKATRVGNKVTLTWTAPGETTDGALVKGPGTMVLRRSSGNQPAAIVARLPLPAALKSQQAEAETVQDSVAELVRSGAADTAVYAVETLNDSGKSAGPSNEATVPLAPTLPPPASLDLQLVPDGIRISWSQVPAGLIPSNSGAQFVYRVFHQEEGVDQPALVAQLDNPAQSPGIVDKNIEWQKKYDYWVVPATLLQPQSGKKIEISGDSSPHASILADDRFPPAVPSGLQAVSSGTQPPFIDLTWSPVSDADLAGYNVYRAAGAGQWTKLNVAAAKTPAFRDVGVQPGGTYTYSVTAVDLRGNESARSQPASEIVPP